MMKVKMLATLALVLLVSRASEGRILSKCELKSQLEAALGGNQGGSGPAPITNGPANVTVPRTTPVPGTGPAPNVTVSVTAPGNVTVPGNATTNLLIAQIVCSVERLSRFNTNLVTTVQVNPRPPVRPQQRPNGRPGRPGGRPSRPGGRGKRSPGSGSRRPGDDSSSSSSESSEENFTSRLLGIFQLSDRVACNSGSGQSLNICKINCRALTDDDIRDDIACLKTLLNIKINVPLALPVNECRNINPAQYFAGCR